MTEIIVNNIREYIAGNGHVLISSFLNVQFCVYKLCDSRNCPVWWLKFILRCISLCLLCSVECVTVKPQLLRPFCENPILSLVIHMCWSYSWIY